MSATTANSSNNAQLGVAHLGKAAAAQPFTCSDATRSAILSFGGACSAVVRTMVQSMLSLLTGMIPLLPGFDEGMRVGCRWFIQRHYTMMRIVGSPLTKDLHDMVVREAVATCEAGIATCAPLTTRARTILNEEIEAFIHTVQDSAEDKTRGCAPKQTTHDDNNDDDDDRVDTIRKQ